MTRVNANLKPSELLNKHLTGEYFEIRRVRHYKPNKSVEDTKFKLGTGHVKFFSTHKTTTIARVKLISEAMLERGLASIDSVNSTMDLFTEAWGHDIHSTDNLYQYTDYENDLVRIRLLQSMTNMYQKRPHQSYFKQRLSITEAINILDFQTPEAIQYKQTIVDHILQNQIIDYVNLKKLAKEIIF